MREDSLALLDRFQGRIPNLFDNYLRIEHLSRMAASDAIQRPLAQYNLVYGTQISIEEELVKAVLDQVRPGRVVLGEGGRGVIAAGAGTDVTGERVEAPYLQLVMTRLWDVEMRAGSSELRLATLEALGGAERIAETHLENTLDTLLPDEQEMVGRVFRHLVTPGGTKIALGLEDLAGYAEVDGAQLKPVLDKLTEQTRRILRPVAPSPDKPNEPRYEIFHDVLAPAILRWCREREQAEAARKAALDAEQRLQEAARERDRARLRWLAIGLAVALIFALVVATYIYGLRGQAQNDANALATAVVQARDAEAQARAAETKTRDLAVNLYFEQVTTYVFVTPNYDVARFALGRALELDPTRQNSNEVIKLKRDIATGLVSRGRERARNHQADQALTDLISGTRTG